MFQYIPRPRQRLRLSVPPADRHFLRGGPSASLRSSGGSGRSSRECASP